MTGRSRAVDKLIRYVIAAIGPIGSAGAQFLLSLAMLRLLSAHDFGTLSFLLVISVFSWGVWSALLCAPLPVVLFQRPQAERVLGEDAILAVNLYGAILSVAIFAGIALSMRLPPEIALLFGGYSAVALMRWFARAHAYAHGRQLPVTASDIAYSGTLLVGVGLIAWFSERSLLAVYGVLMISAVAGLLPFGRRYFARQFMVGPRALRHYVAVWRDQASWSLLGIITTEATGNAHAYLVTLILGPTAFAPIAASALVTRPISVATNALADFERPLMSRLIGEGRIAEVWQSIGVFRLVLMAIWVGTGAAVVAMYIFAPRLIFPPRYDLHTLVIGTVMWMVVAWLRMLRVPEGSVLHASGEFKPLAYASLWSSIVAVGMATAMIVFAGALWSIIGIILGQAAFTYWTIVYARRMLSQSKPLPADHLPDPGEPVAQHEEIGA